MKYIKLTQGKRTVVDDEDYIIISRMRWFAFKCKSGIFYAATYNNGKQIFLHNFLISPPKGFEIDHKDGNGLNNIKNNLRACTHAQNARNKGFSKNNRSGFKGVHARGKNFRSFICVNYKTINLGEYSTKEEAARVYDEGAIKYFREFARTNRMLGLLK